MDSSVSCSDQKNQDSVPKNEHQAKVEHKHWLEYAFCFRGTDSRRNGICCLLHKTTMVDSRRYGTAATTRLSRSFFSTINEADGSIAFDLSNGGQTPAINIHGILNIAAQAGGQEIPEDFTFPEGPRSPGEVYESFGHVLPQKTLTITFGLEREEINILKKARAGGVAVFIYGHFDYRDVFGTEQSCTFAFIANRGSMLQARRHNDCR